MVELLAGICWTKSQSPRYSPGAGRLWLQMTSALLAKYHGLCRNIKFTKLYKIVYKNENIFSSQLCMENRGCKVEHFRIISVLISVFVELTG